MGFQSHLLSTEEGIHSAEEQWLALWKVQRGIHVIPPPRNSPRRWSIYTNDSDAKQKQLRARRRVCCCSVVSDSLQRHGLPHSKLPYPSPSPRVCSNPCPLSRWCHPTVSSSVAPFSSCPQPFPASGSFPMKGIGKFKKYLQLEETRIGFQFEVEGCGGIEAGMLGQSSILVPCEQRQNTGRERHSAWLQWKVCAATMECDVHCVLIVCQAHVLEVSHI